MLDPLLMEPGNSVYRIASVTGSAALGIIMLSASIIGFLRDRARIWERMVLACSAFALIKPGVISDLIGAAGLILVLAVQSLRVKREKLHAAVDQR
jgi:TRAP-type uncharacterized transport system fused permease subunit